MNYKFFLFRFTCESDCDVIFGGGPWVVDDVTLGLESWSPTFLSSPECLSRIILWMTLRPSGVC
jgi:hypothetical protein